MKSLMQQVKEASERTGINANTLKGRMYDHDISLDEAIAMQFKHGGARNHEGRRFNRNEITGANHNVNEKAAPKFDWRIAQRYHGLKLIGE